MKHSLLISGLLSMLVFSGSAQRLRDYQSLERNFRQNPYDENAMNMRAIESIHQASRSRASGFANELAQYASINNANDPGRVLQQFEAQKARMEQLIAQRNEQLVQQGFQAAANIGNLRSNSSSGEYINAIGGGVSAFTESIEAKQAAEAHRAELESQRRRQMWNIRKTIINENNQALEEQVERAAYALNPDEEDFYLEVARFYSAHNNYIQSNFSYGGTQWAANPYAPPSKPVLLPNQLKTRHEKYLDAARRKQDLYVKHKQQFPVLNEAAVKFANGAIHEKPEDLEAYLLLSEITATTDLATSYSSMLIARKVSPGHFRSPDNSALLEKRRDAYAAYFRDAALNDNLEVLQEGINMGLHRGLKIEDKGVLSWTIEADKADLLQLLVNKEIVDNGRDQSKLAGILAMACLKDAQGCVGRMLRLGLDPDTPYRGTLPVIVASRAASLNSFRLLYAKSNKQASHRRFFLDPANAEFASGYMMVQLEDELRAGKTVAAEPFVQFFARRRQPELVLDQVCQIAADEHKPELTRVLRPLTAAAPAEVGNAYFERALAGNEPDIAQALYMQGLTDYDFRPDHEAEKVAASQKSKGPHSSQATSHTANSLEGLAQLMVESGEAVNQELALSSLQLTLEPTIKQLVQAGTFENREEAESYLVTILIEQYQTRATEEPQESNPNVPRLKNSGISNPILRQVIARDQYQILIDLSRKGVFSGYETELINAIVNANAQRSLQKLNRMGLSYSQKDEQGFTLMHRLAYQGRLDLARALAQASPALLNTPGQYGWTPLHFAARQNNSSMVKYLLSAGADPKLKDKWGRRPYHIAKERDYTELKTQLR